MFQVAVFQVAVFQNVVSQIVNVSFSRGCQELKSLLLLPLQQASVGVGLIPALMDLLTLVTIKAEKGGEQFAGEGGGG